MSQHANSRFEFDRRRWMKLSAASALALTAPNRLLDAQSGPPSCDSTIPRNHEPSNDEAVPKS